MLGTSPKGCARAEIFCRDLNRCVRTMDIVYTISALVFVVVAMLAFAASSRLVKPRRKTCLPLILPNRNVDSEKRTNLKEHRWGTDSLPCLLPIKRWGISRTWEKQEAFINF